MMEKSNQLQQNIPHGIRASYAQGKNTRGTFIIPNTNYSNNEQKFVIRPDSPRTKQAALFLGIEISNFKIKTIEEFAGPDVTEEIQEMRYEHYINRLKSDINQIQQKRKEMIQEQKVKHQQKMQLEKSFGNQDSTYWSYQAEYSPEAMNQAYERTINILKKQNNRPSLLKANEVFDLTEEGGGANELEEKLYQEIDQFNKLKMQKQQEAKQILESEVKKLQMMKEMKEREEKVKQKLIQDQKNKEKMKKEKRLQAQEKLQQIKNQEANFRKKKELERQKIQQKLALLKEKQAKEEEERERIKEEQEERNQQRKEKMQNYFREYKQLEEEKCMQTMNQIQQKFSQSMDLQQSINMARLENIHEKQKEEEYKKIQVKEYHEKKEKDQVQSVVKKMIEKEENNRQYMKKLREKEKERQKELKMKNEKFLSNVQGNQHQEEIKLDRLNQRFLKIEENLARKKAEQEQRIRLQQEERRLKQLDQIENNERVKRQNEYRLQTILDRQKQHDRNIMLRRNQSELLQKAKHEVAIQYKLESERIFKGLHHASDRLFPMSNKNLNKYLTPQNKYKGFKILKSIFNQNDVENTIKVLDPPKKVDEEKNNA